jgi:hypothetical protein
MPAIKTSESAADVFDALAQVMIDNNIAVYQQADGVINSSKRSPTIDPCQLNLVPMHTVSQPSLINMVKDINAALEQRSKHRKADLQHLSNDQHFSNLDENGVLLLHRFVKKRDDMLQNHQFVNASTFGKLLGINDLNIPRKIKQLRDKNEMLHVETANTVIYPLFQLNREGKVYPALKAAIPRFLSAGRSHFDICFWLLSEQSIIISSPAIDAQALSQMSFDEMQAFGKANEAQTIDYTGSAIDTLVNGDNATFSMMVDEWINPDDRVVIKGSVS